MWKRVTVHTGTVYTWFYKYRLDSSSEGSMIDHSLCTTWFRIWAVYKVLTRHIDSSREHLKNWAEHNIGKAVLQSVVD